MSKILNQLRAPFLLSLLAILVFSLLVSLGIWQVKRYTMKKNLQAQFTTQQAQTPIEFTQLNTQADQQFLPVKATGHYLPQYTFLLDNKFHQHQAGYHVFTLFQVENFPQALLVNQGWVAREAIDTLPDIDTKQRTLYGTLQSPSNKAFLLGENITQQQHTILQAIDVSALEKLFSITLHPQMLLLNADGNTTTYVREWRLITMPAHKHMGYAIQWFSLATVLAGIYLIFLFRYLKNCKQHL
jgi:surfeit locus 1 family protein